MRHLVRIALLVAVFPLPHGHAQTLSRAEDVGMSSEQLARIVPAMQRFVDDGNVSGIVTLVARRGRVVHFEAVGHQNIAEGTAMTTDTIVRLFSMTKPKTVVAVMMLLEAGHLQLTDPVSRYLPEFTDIAVYVGGQADDMRTTPASTMTIEQLLTHTAGLTFHFNTPSPVARMYDEAGVRPLPHVTPFTSLAEWTRALASLPLVVQPGSAWNYSVGIDVLGRVVEVVSGDTLRGFLRDRLFKPLHMDDTDFYVPDEKLSRFATLYQLSPDGVMSVAEDGKASAFRNLSQLQFGGGGLVSTAADYFRFAQMLVNGSAYNGVRLLDQGTVDPQSSLPEVSDAVETDPATR